VCRSLTDGEVLSESRKPQRLSSRHYGERGLITNEGRFIYEKSFRGGERVDMNITDSCGSLTVTALVQCKYVYPGGEHA
jgi:hypothetical protein